MSISLLLAGAARASVLDGFLDPTDGQFDVSDFLLNKRGLLFNPLIVTEPAVGYGGGGTLMYFHKQKEDHERAEQGEVLGLPPSISFGVGLGTENGTWAAGGGHFGTWRRDSIRYLGAVGYTSANLDFFVNDRPFAYNLEGVFLVQDFDFRVKGSPFFLGGRYVFSHLRSKFDAPFDLPPPLDQTFTENIGGLGVSVLFDTRNNVLDPTDGEMIEVLPTFFGPWMGGDEWFQLLDMKARSFNRLSDRFVLNLRVDSRLSFSNPPFYVLPRINLRGVSASRYQGPFAGEGEIETRFRVWKRWSLVGFFGVGWATPKESDLELDGSVVPAGGAGFRYLIARQLGLNMGMDFAGSEDQFAFYFQVGSAWR